MKLLVTGGAGYIGSVVSRLLLAEGHDVTVLDNLSTGHADAVADGAEFVEADLSDAGVVLAAGHYDGVLHVAAKSLVGESMTKPSLYWRNNVGGSRDLLDAVTTTGVPRFVFSSTAAVYGEPDEVPIRGDCRDEAVESLRRIKARRRHDAARRGGRLWSRRGQPAVISMSRERRVVLANATRPRPI